MNDELMHYRTKGSKNGERRYQYEDGSLTPLGREHYGIGPPREKKGESIVARFASKRAAKKKKKEESMPMPTKAGKKVKTFHDLSDEELQRRIDRMELERSYVAAANLYRDTMGKTGFGKKLVAKLEDKAVDAIAGLVVDTGKELTKKFLNEKFDIFGDGKDKKDKKDDKQQGDKQDKKDKDKNK